MDEARLQRIEVKLDKLDEKLDIVLNRLPTFVTWRNLGALGIAIATLGIGIANILG